MRGSIEHALGEVILASDSSTLLRMMVREQSQERSLRGAWVVTIDRSAASAERREFLHRV